MFDWTKKRVAIVAGGLEHYRTTELVHCLLALGAQVETAVLPSFCAHTVVSALVPARARGKLGGVRTVQPGQLGSSLLQTARAGAVDLVVVVGCAEQELEQETAGLGSLADHCGVTIVEPLGWGAVSLQRVSVVAESARIVRVGAAQGEKSAFVDAVLSALRLTLGQVTGDMVGVPLLVSAGGTREWLDPVRHIGNRASGKMGFQIAAAARDRGATVTLIAASPLSEPLVGVRVEHASTVASMREVVLRHSADHAVLIMAAALSDFRPESPSAQKIKKQGQDPLVLRLAPNPNFIVELPRRLLKVGFAAETENVLEYAASKRARRGFDIVCANDVSRTDIGFEVDSNEVVVIDADGPRVHLPRAHKYRIAHGILDALMSDIHAATNELRGGER